MEPERTPYFSIATGEGAFDEALASRGLRGVWNAKYSEPDHLVPTGTDQRIEWKRGDWSASATRYFRSVNGAGARFTLHSVVLSLTSTPELEKWHRDALISLSKVAGQGAHQFNKTVAALTGTP